MQRQTAEEGNRAGPPFGCEYCGLGGFPTLSALHGHRRSHVSLLREERSFSTEEAHLSMATRFGGAASVPDSYRRNLEIQLRITRSPHHRQGPIIDLNASPPPDHDTNNSA